jgi:predicted N-acyltransferase
MNSSKSAGENDPAAKAPERETKPAAGLRIVAVNAISEVPAAAWDACANPSGKRDCGAVSLAVQETPSNPFLSHAFLSSLESSKSVGSRTGWQVQHVLVQAADGTLVAAAPCYLKNHSQGEYVFDHGWAEAYEHAGGSYYPKLQVAVPFTPATGRRLLLRPGPHADDARQALVGGLVAL